MSCRDLSISDVPIEDAPHGYIHLYCTNCGASRIIAKRCKDRLCPSCTRKSAKALIGRTYGVMKHLEIPAATHWSHLILTQITDRDLQFATRNIVSKFRRLRSTKYWKSTVLGGFYSIEANDNESGWHVHIHAVILHHFIEQPTIASLWSNVSHYKANVWLRIIPPYENIKGIIIEVVKYSVKSSRVRDENVWLFNRIMRSRKLFSNFGCISKLFKLRKIVRPQFECPICHFSKWTQTKPIVHRLKHSTLPCNNTS